MTTSPTSGLSAEAKEFVPSIPPSTVPPSANIPLYVDENTVASIYPSDHQPLMVQTIYPMMISNSKGTDNLQFPEIEFHIQPSQQQQFHIDSCSNLSQPISISNGNSSTSNTSQIVLLPANSSAGGFYPPPPPPILYSPNEPPLQAYYPLEYCEPSLINFSLHQPNFTSKSSRISSQQSRGNSFRPAHGSYRSSTRGSSRGGGSINRNAYYDYSNRRNGSSARGSASMNKRISSAYHSHDYNNYYHPSARSRGYASRSNPVHEDYRKDQFDYYQSEKDFYDNDYPPATHLNDDGTPFEFRPEDFPSLPNNPNQPSDKTPPQTSLSTNPKPASSWNAIVSSNPPRPHSTSPQPIPPCEETRSDRSRSFNVKSSSQSERKSSSRKAMHLSPSTRASKPEDQAPTLAKSKSDLPLDDGFIQTKQQHRRLKRRNKFKEESSTAYALEDEQTAPERKPSTSLDKTLGSLAISTEHLEGEEEEQQQTDTNRSENPSASSTRLSSSSNNSSDTSDYDDAVDNFDAE